MDTHVLQGHFARMGAELAVKVHDEREMQRQRRTNIVRTVTNYVLNVVGNGRSSEHFTLDIWPAKADSLEFITADLRSDMRHLLLVVKRLDDQHSEVSKDKFLCGHDERHWFIATVPEQNGIANVTDAMEALKPTLAMQSQRRHKVRTKNWHNRRNAGFVRQGEWFFIPQPRFTPDNSGLILRNEPIRRAFGKAHIVEEVYRIGGETVYVCSRRPNGITEAQYQRLLVSDPKAQGWNWRVMRRNPQVYARGTVRHPDHKTIVLPYWHRVAMATERSSAAGGRPATVAFLD
ncbi:MAG: hypothetical protein H6658_04140 [Ardenticatenaceae bacterium]|nr:hypothetical protein [Ardenticatenaceae bacterium]